MPYRTDFRANFRKHVLQLPIFIALFLFVTSYGNGSFFSSSNLLVAASLSIALLSVDYYQLKNSHYSVEDDGITYDNPFFTTEYRYSDIEKIHFNEDGLKTIELLMKEKSWKTLFRRKTGILVERPEQFYEEINRKAD